MDNEDKSEIEELLYYIEIIVERIDKLLYKHKNTNLNIDNLINAYKNMSSSAVYLFKFLKGKI